jgi:hypothetical protein
MSYNQFIFIINHTQSTHALFLVEAQATASSTGGGAASAVAQAVASANAATECGVTPPPTYSPAP